MAQLDIVTGKLKKPDYVARINAQTPYLQSLYQYRADNAFRDKEFAQSEKELAESSRRSDVNTSIAFQNLDAQKKQAKRANLISGAELGITALNQSDDGGIFSNFFGGDTGDTAADATGGGIAELFNTAKDSVSSAASTGSPFLSGVGSKLFDSFKKPGVWGSGAFGATVGGMLGDSDLEKAAIGAGAGALTNFATSGGLKTLLTGGGLSGGSIFGAVSSGILGLGGGLF